MITIYKTSHCAYCLQVQKLLDKYKAKYEVVNLDDNPDLRQEIIDKTHSRVVPVTTDGHTYVIGWNPFQIAQMAKGQSDE